jgi:hypothetical protein
MLCTRQPFQISFIIVLLIGLFLVPCVCFPFSYFDDLYRVARYSAGLKQLNKTEYLKFLKSAPIDDVLVITQKIPKSQRTGVILELAAHRKLIKQTHLLEYCRKTKSFRNYDETLAIHIKNNPKNLSYLIDRDIVRLTGQIASSLKPNSTTMINGYEYISDSYGRVKKVVGRLRLDTTQRNAFAQKKAAKLGIAGDEGGHLIGSRFGGSGGMENLVPQSAHLNRGEWKAMENLWDRALRNGDNVHVTITPVYKGPSVRPHLFDVTYSISGISTTKLFKNR